MEEVTSQNNIQSHDRNGAFSLEETSEAMIIGALTRYEHALGTILTLTGHEISKIPSQFSHKELGSQVIINFVVFRVEVGLEFFRVRSRWSLEDKRKSANQRETKPY